MNSNRQKSIAWVKAGDCMKCTSHARRQGYTVFQRDHKLVSIARAIILRRLRVDKSELHARHSCDNRWCINPAHITAGTHQDNMDDMTTRGRSRKATGEKNSNAKLTEDQARAILWSKGLISAVDLAQMYGIKPNTVSRIWRRLIWKHI